MAVAITVIIAANSPMEAAKTQKMQKYSGKSGYRTINGIPRRQPCSLSYLFLLSYNVFTGVPAPEQLAEDYINAYKTISKFFAEHRDISFWR